MKKVVFLFGIVCLVLFSFLEMIEDVEAAGNLMISELYYDTTGLDSAEEWMEVTNFSEQAIDLSDYKIGDEEENGGGEGMYQWPASAVIEAGAQVVVAKDAVGFYNLYGKYPDFEIDSADDGAEDFSNTPDMIKYSSWGSGSLSLTNTGDEVLMLDPTDNVIDVVVYENGVYAGVMSHPGVGSGESLARIDENDSDDCAVDFLATVNPTPNYQWTYRAGDHFSNTGTVEDGYVSAKVDTDDAGHLFFGPYTADQDPGLYQASWRLRVNDNTNVNSVVRIDAYNSEGDGQWVYRDILGTDFRVAGEWQNFSLFFNRLEEGTMEYRVYFNDETDVDLAEVIVGKVDHMVWEGEDLAHNNGVLVADEIGNGLSWSSDQSGYMIYGPYAPLPIGFYEANWVTAVDDNTIVANVITADILNPSISRTTNLTGTDFAESEQYQSINLGFLNNTADQLTEFRLFNQGLAAIKNERVILRQTDELIFEAEHSPGFGIVATDNDASGDGYKIADPEIDEAGWMVFGPYEKNLAPGNYRASFDLKTDDGYVGEVGGINVFDAGGNHPELWRELTTTDFDQPGEWQEFNQDFTLTDEANMEFRVWFADAVKLGVDEVRISRI